MYNDSDLPAQDFRTSAEIACQIYSTNRDQPEVLRKAAFLAGFAAQSPVRILEGELIVGPHFLLEGSWRWREILGEEHYQGMAFHGNIGHVIVDFDRVLRLGVDGLLAHIRTISCENDNQMINRQAFHTTVEAFSCFIQRYGDEAALLSAGGEEKWADMRAVAANCRLIAHQPPHTFWQALQLVWFTQVFLHAEAMAQAISFGRFDQYLGAYLERDLASGLLTSADAEELLADFWKKCNAIGDPSQNLVVGGVDTQNRCAENALSFLCMDVARKLRLPQPSLSVRIAPNTSEKFWGKALSLCTAGFGMPSFFNDPVVIRSLEAVGIPTERARDWGIVGCYEANPQGDTLGLTVAGAFSLPQVFLEFFQQAVTYGSFDNFLTDYKQYLAEFYARELVKYQATYDQFYVKDSASPFQSLCLGDCIEQGLTAEEGGARFLLYGVNIMGLATLVDSLLAVKELVFERQALSMEAFRQQLVDDFPDEALLARCRNMPGKYGTGAAFTDALAQDLLHETAELVLSNPLDNGVRPYPGFFWFLQDVYTLPGATPDGRRTCDRVSYGVAPSELGQGKTATSILLSTARLAHDLCPCGNPLTLSMNHNDVNGVAGAERLKSLIETYFQEGGFHLHFNIVEAQQLREAKEKPHEHGELTVRISGFSAKFVDLDSVLQDAIVDRTEKGI